MHSVFFECTSKSEKGDVVFVITVRRSNNDRDVHVCHLRYSALAQLPPRFNQDSSSSNTNSNLPQFPPKTLGAATPTHWYHRIQKLNDYFAAVFGRRGTSLTAVSHEPDSVGLWANDTSPPVQTHLGSRSYVAAMFASQAAVDYDVDLVRFNAARVHFSRKFGSTGYITRVEYGHAFPNLSWIKYFGDVTVVRDIQFARVAAKENFFFEWVAEGAQGFSGSLFEDQVAGHKGDDHMLLEDETILKPFNEDEWLFYQDLDSVVGIPPNVFARFSGRRRIAQSKTLPRDYLVLENLCSGLGQPLSVIDLKIGANSKGKTESKALKKFKQGIVQLTSTSGKLGLRVAGCKIYRDGALFKEISQAKGNFLSISGFHEVLIAFLAPLSNTQRKQILEQLDTILRWFEKQQTVDLNSSSILLMYDSTPTCIPRVRLIDFAHSFVFGPNAIFPKDVDVSSFEESRRKFIGGIQSLYRVVTERIQSSS